MRTRANPIPLRADEGLILDCGGPLCQKDARLPQMGGQASSRPRLKSDRPESIFRSARCSDIGARELNVAPVAAKDEASNQRSPALIMRETEFCGVPAQCYRFSDQFWVFSIAMAVQGIMSVGEALAIGQGSLAGVAARGIVLAPLSPSIGGENGPAEGAATDRKEPAHRALGKLLIVEDEILTADYLHYLLTELGYEVCGHAATAAAAVNLAGERRPDLVLMDVNLGRGGDGIEAAENIVKQFGIRSLFVTAYGDRVTLQRAEAAQPAGILFKPFDKARLGSALAAARDRLSRN
jgi:CheY-like chemotaxis protein